MMRVMLVDDHPLFLEGLQNLLQAHGVEVAGTAGNGNQALIQARELKPDVILMDIAMPVCSGLDAIYPIKQEMPRVKIVMPARRMSPRRIWQRHRSRMQPD